MDLIEAAVSVGIGAISFVALTYFFQKIGRLSDARHQKD